MRCVKALSFLLSLLGPWVYVAFASELDCPGPGCPAPPVTAATPQPPLSPSPLPSPSQPKISTLCAKVAQSTFNNGSFQVSGNDIDAEQALNEQFCLARAFFIKNGEVQMNRVGFTVQQVRSYCRDFLRFVLVAVPGKLLADPTETGKVTRAAFEKSQMSLEDASYAAQLCMSFAYESSDDNGAFRLAAVVANTYSAEFAEIVAHHIRLGFGVIPSSTSAAPWYEAAINLAYSQNVAPTIVPNQPDRQELITEAVNELYQ